MAGDEHADAIRVGAGAAGSSAGARGAGWAAGGCAVRARALAVRVSRGQVGAAGVRSRRGGGDAGGAGGGWHRRWSWRSPACICPPRCLSRWMARSPAAPFWARGSPRRLPGGSRAPASCTKSPGPPGQPARRQACPGRPISCWTGWSCWSPRVAPKRYTLAGPGSAGLCRRRDHQRGAAAVVGTGRDGREHGVGRRALARDRGPPCPVLSRGGLAGPASAFGERIDDHHGLAWRFRGGCFAGRGGGGDRGATGTRFARYGAVLLAGYRERRPGPPR